MTAFVLVPGAHTGGWIWDEVAARLRESGAEAYPVTLTGMGDRGHPAGPDTDLEAHIQDLLRLIDQLDAPQLVLVGHCYGIHPVLGAADRRPERIARVVHLDTGIPQDGDPALKLVPDEAIRDRLTQRADPAGDDGRLPPPPPGGWQRWGSVAGVPADALAQLARRAAPQPVGTLTQPLRLSGAGSALPATGVLCTANGPGIAMVEALVGLGDPRVQALAEPRLSFFELATGHWPMLSSPDELAGLLLRAAAGEGHRLAAEEPADLRRFLMDVPERPRERVGRVDLYLPDGLPDAPLDDLPDGLTNDPPYYPPDDLTSDPPDDLPGDLPDTEHPRPAVVFVHGGPIHPDVRPTPRDWSTFVGYGRYVASLGAVGVTLDHRLHDLADYGRAAEDVAAAVESVRADPRVDGERVALWFFSGGGLLSADWLAAPPPWLRCVAATYPVLAPLPDWGLGESRFRPAVAVRTAGRLPIVVTRVGLESAEIAVTVEEFLTAAKDGGADVEVVDLPLGHHGFETKDHTEEARRAVERAVRSVLGHLRS